MNKSNFRTLLRYARDMKKNADNVPAALFRDMIAEHGPSIAEWDARMDRYFRKIHGNDPKIIAQEKTNLTRALTKDTLTWRRFEQAVQIMGPKTYRLSVTMEFANGQKYTHSVRVKNRFGLDAGELEIPNEHDDVTDNDDEDEE